MGVTNIEWTATVNPDGSITPGRTWNPTTGCTRVSPGCKNCYAFQLHDMRHKAHSEGKAVPAQYAKPFKELQLFEDRLAAPLSWRKPQRIFVNSMSDLFHKDVPDEFLLRVFDTMRRCTWAGGQNCGKIGGNGHTFQILTKRPDRMREFMSRLRWTGEVIVLDKAVPGGLDSMMKQIWLGTSVENQAAADERIPHLQRTPATVRFLSCEPLLGEVNLRRFFHHSYRCRAYVPPPAPVSYAGQGEGCTCPMLHWVIVGGESGAGARPCNVAWVRSIVEQCKTAGVPCFVKQLGSNYADENNGICGHDTKWPFDVLPSGPYYRLRDKKGGDMQEWPEPLRVREFPKAVNA